MAGDRAEMGQGRARGRWAKHRASHQVVVLNLSWAWSPLLQPTAVPRDLFSPGQSHSGDLLASAPISQARACQGSACARHILGAPWFPGEGRRGRSPELRGLCQLAWPGPSPGTLLDSQECWKQSRSPSLQTRRPHVAPTAHFLTPSLTWPCVGGGRLGHRGPGGSHTLPRPDSHGPCFGDSRIPSCGST